MKKARIVLLFFFSLSIQLQAQDLPFRTCDTDLKWKELIKADPQAALRNAFLKSFRPDYLSTANRSVSAAGVVLYRIPVVFHVMHLYANENISKAQILDAVDILNKSFQKLNDDTAMVIPLFQPIFADCQIEFVLANTDPFGNCTDGITRTYTPFTAYADDNVKSLIDWPSDKYFNIWVVRNIASGAAGYAYYPGAAASIDGVVIRHDYVGSFGTSNGTNHTERSLTHEAGHGLDLPHTWGSTNFPGLASNCNTDDGITDTPNTIGVDNFSCNTAQSTCGAVDNVQNYMDYASCHYMFTEGQKGAMHAALNSPVGNRDNLSTISNLIATGTAPGHIMQSCAPVADFSNKKIYRCQGGSVTFKDVSWKGDITTRTWQFPGGIPSTDTAANPTVTYPVPGGYDVTLSVSNANGSDLITRSGIVEVFSNPGLVNVPYAEGFENINFPTAEWSFENPENNNTFFPTWLAAASGSNSLYLNNQAGGSSPGDIDAIITPTFDLSGVSGAMLSFKYAFAARSNADTSELKVFVSASCGSSWLQRLNLKGAALRTAPNQNGNFIPAAAQWTTQTVNFSPTNISGKPSVRVKFEFVNVDANNFYLDDINLNGTTGMNELLAQQFQFEAFPNPANDKMRVQLQLDEAATIRLELSDIHDRVVYFNGPEERSGQLHMDIDGAQLEGIYLLRIFVNERQFTRKIAFIH